MFAVQFVDQGGYAVYELLDSVDLEVGAELACPEINTLGSLRLRLVDTGETFDASGQSGSCSSSAAQRLLA
jgi:hypothetical protein